MAHKISFASFNLYNFQSAGKSTYGQHIVTASEYNKKRTWTRAMVRDLDADVIAFQELWSMSCLKQVFSTHDLKDYTLVFIKGEWYNTAVALAVRSPYQLLSKQVIKQFPFTELVNIDDSQQEDDDFSMQIRHFSRSILKVKIKHSADSDDRAITLYACHLKSKLPSRVDNSIANANKAAIGSALSAIRRTAESTALRIILSEQLTGKNTPTVVIGDLNDDPYSNVLSIITEQPTMTQQSTGTDKGLYNALFLQQLVSFRDVLYTHEFKNHKGVIDHILVSEEFFEFSHDCMWKHKNTKIWNDHIEDGNDYSTDHGIIRSEFG